MLEEKHLSKGSYLDGVQEDRYRLIHQFGELHLPLMMQPAPAVVVIVTADLICMDSSRGYVKAQDLEVKSTPPLL